LTFENLYQAETGEEDDKGHENQRRKIFKQMIAGELSSASTVPIGADNLVVVSVTPDASTNYAQEFFENLLLQMPQRILLVLIQTRL
jgi:hypothetical protein